MEESPLGSAVMVGVAYVTGALVPVLPVLIGAKDALFSVFTAGSWSFSSRQFCHSYPAWISNDGSS